MRFQSLSPPTAPDPSAAPAVVKWGGAAAAAGAAGIALYALGTWWIGGWRQGTFGEWFVPMAPSTALLFVLLGGAVLARCLWPRAAVGRRVAYAAVTVTLLLGTLVVVEFLRRADSPWETWLAGTRERVAGVAVGRMSVLTAGMFIAAAISLAAQLPGLVERRALRYLGLSLAAVGLLSGLVTAFAYASATPIFYGLGIVPVALLTALAFVALDLALMLTGGLEAWRRRLDQGWDPDEAQRAPRRLAGLILAGMGIAVAGFVYLRHQQEALSVSIGNGLSAIADLKAEQIAAWRAERRDDAEFLMRAPDVTRDLALFLADPESAARRRAALVWLDLLKGGDRYEGTAFFDSRLLPRLTSTGSTLVIGPVMRQELAAAAQSREAVVGDLHLSVARTVRMDLVVPLFGPREPGAAAGANPASGPGELMGLIVLRLNPGQFLFPMLRAWPVPSASAETLLVRREGDRVIFLSELRFRPHSALAFSRPLSDAALAAVQAVRGAGSPADGIDYRGVPVLAAFRAIPGTSWIMVAKVDQAEIYASLGRQALAGGAIVVLLLIAAVLGSLVYSRHRHAARLERRREALEGLVRERTAAVEAETTGRRRAEAELRLRAEAERLLLEIATSLLAAGLEEADTAITRALGRLAVFVGADSAYLFVFDQARQMLSQSHLWQAPTSVAPRARLQELPVSAVSWWVGQLREGREVVVESVSRLPAAAESEKRMLLSRGVHAVVDMPMMVQGENIGFVGLGAEREGHFWRVEDIDLLRILAQVMASALKRQAVESELRRHRGRLEELVALRTAALRESEQRFQILFEQAQVAIGVARGPRVLFVNPACARLFGLAGPEDMRGRDLAEFIAPASRDQVAEALRQLLVAGTGRRELEAAALRADGLEFPLYAACSTLELADGAAILTFLIDITERKRAEAALRESEYFLSRSQEVANLGSYTYDVAAGRWTGTAALDRLFGIDGRYPHDLAGWLALIVPEQREMLQRHLLDDVLSRRGRFEKEYEIVRPADGRRRWVFGLGELELAGDGRPVRMIGVIQDITERRYAERALRESEVRFRTLVENAPEAVFVGTDLQSDTGPKFAYLNAAALRLFGAARGADLVGRPVRERVHPDSRALLARRIRQTMEERFSPPMEEIYLRLDGSPVPVEVAAARIDYLGEVGGVVFVHDISERKKAEEKIREQTFLLETATDAIMVRDLQHRILYWNRSAELLYGWPADEVMGREVPELQGVAAPALDTAFEVVLRTGEWTGEVPQRTRAGQELTVLSRWSLVRDERGLPKSVFVINTDITERKKLEAQLYRAQRLESVGQLASGIAHDLNNILAPLVMVAPLLRTEIRSPDILRLVDILEGNTKRGVEVVKQILTFSRGLKAGKGIVPARPLLKEIVNVLDETFPKSIAVQSSIPEDLWMVEGDATQLHQVLMNLCVNARDAMPDGGTLTLAAENVMVDELYASMSPGAKPGPYTVWLVADTGTGIPPEHLDRIFDPFFTTKEPGKGTGLGLSTVIGIVRGHHGFIKVESRVGKGTQFRIYLPAQVGAQAPAEASPAEPPPAGRGETILIVDDEEGVRMLTKKILEQHGYRVLLASEGSEAVVAYAQHAGQVAGVVTDLMMPLMDGATLIRALRQIAPAVRILATTGVTESAHVAAALRLGAKEVLHKPYSPHVLLRRLRAMLDEAEPPA